MGRRSFSYALSNRDIPPTSPDTLGLRPRAGTRDAAPPPITPAKLAISAAFLALAACGAPRASSRAASAPDAVPSEYGRRVVAKAASCWVGGLWADAIGERGEDARQTGIDERCASLLDEIGATPEETYYTLRAIDPRIVARLEAKLETRGAKELAPLLRVIADAARENLHARQAADRVKRDYVVDANAAGAADATPAQGDPGAGPGRRAADKGAAAAPLRADDALGELLRYDGVASDDARAVGLLLALDRLEIARGLPKHLKVYAVTGALRDVFGVEPPRVSDDATAPIPTGTWLAYLTRTAAVAGHPVPATAEEPQDREALAWTGVLAGFADRLKKAGGDDGVRTVAHAVAARLDDEHLGARNAVDYKKGKTSRR